MKEHAVLSALGRDRVGVARDLVEDLKKAGLEIKRSRMSSLDGRFAILAQVSAEEGGIEKLQGELDPLREKLNCHLQLDRVEIADPTAEAASGPGKDYGVEILLESFTTELGNFHALEALLSRNEVNIEHLETEVSPAPFTSKLTFQMTARVRVPESCPIAELKDELRRLERERNIDVLVKPCPAVGPPAEVG